MIYSIYRMSGNASWTDKIRLAAKGGPFNTTPTLTPRLPARVQAPTCAKEYDVIYSIYRMIGVGVRPGRRSQQKNLPEFRRVGIQTKNPRVSLRACPCSA